MKACDKCAALIKDDATQCRWCNAARAETIKPDENAARVLLSDSGRMGSPRPRTFGQPRVLIAAASLALVILTAYIFLGFYTIQPLGAVPEGQTWLVRRSNDEPFFNSADGLSLRRVGSVSLLTRSMALGQAPKERILMRLPFWEFAYLQSTGGMKFDR
jgi:hypothetical protein